jgi:yecA family protein
LHPTTLAPYHRGGHQQVLRVQVPSHSNYAEIQRHLSESRALTDAAEAHGTLTGALCAAGAYRLEDWLAEILPEDALAAGHEEMLRALYEDTCVALASTLMQFEPLLPDDSQPLMQRTEALTLWCNGFVYGLGVSSAHDPERLPGDAGEIVRDLSQIMHAGVNEADGLEANEAALAELIEFVRVGVQVIFEDLGALRSSASATDATLHQTPARGADSGRLH